MGKLMAGSAPLILDLTLSDDETLTFAQTLTGLDDITPFPFADFTFEWGLGSNGRRHSSYKEGQGITVQAPVVTFKAANPGPGTYDHDCLIVSKVDGSTFGWFDGTIIITRGVAR